jgi:hypothetical protein
MLGEEASQVALIGLHTKITHHFHGPVTCSSKKVKLGLKPETRRPYESKERDKSHLEINASHKDAVRDDGAKAGGMVRGRGVVAGVMRHWSRRRRGSAGLRAD